MTTLAEALRRLLKHYADPEARATLRGDLALLEYFVEARVFASSGRELEAMLDGMLETSEMISLERGKLLYSLGDGATHGYFLVSGQLKLYSRKSEWERTEFIKFGRRLGQLSRIKEICSITCFEEQELPKKVVEDFTDDKLDEFVRFNHFHTVEAGGYLGFAELVKLLSRPFTALATENCKLIAISFSNFEKYLLEYERLKQIKMIEMLCVNMEPALFTEVKNMFHYLGPFIVLKKCACEEVIEREGVKVAGCYLITKGEFETYKEVELRLPKEYSKREIKSMKAKTVDVTIARLLPGQLVGQEEIVVNKHIRTYTLKSISGQSEALKIDSGEFLRLLNERYDVLKFISKRAKEKARANQNKFKEASDQLIEGFYRQYHDYEERKQDKLVEQVVGQNKLSTDEIECLKEVEPGIFYRDTFEKIEKMALFSGASIGDNYKELVKKRRSKVVKGNTYERQEAIQRVELDVSAQEKLLFSNKKHMNRAALMANYLDHRESRALPPDTPKASNHKRTKSNSPPRRETFKEDKLRINEQAHKRVLIQKGIYKRQIAPLYEPVKPSTAFKEHFGPVIENCIIRKNQGIKRIGSPTRRKEVIDTTYKTIVKKSRQRFDDSTVEPVRMFHSWTIKDLRKTFSTFSRTQRPSEHQSISPLKTTRNGFQTPLSHKELISQFDCIIAPSKLRREARMSQQEGITSLADYQSSREYYTAGSRPRPEGSRSGPKLILLNHMMKPISYIN